MVFGNVVTAVHEVVGHYIDKVEGGTDGRRGGGGEGEHVPREAGDSGGEEVGRAKGGAESREEERIGCYLPLLF